jgi:hypothetical protein
MVDGFVVVRTSLDNGETGVSTLVRLDEVAAIWPEGDNPVLARVKMRNGGTLLLFDDEDLAELLDRLSFPNPHRMSNVMLHNTGMAAEDDDPTLWRDMFWDSCEGGRDE